LTLSDLEVVERRIEKATKKTRSGDKEAVKELEILKGFYEALAEGTIPQYGENDDMNALLKELRLLSTLPSFICANVDENTLLDGIDGFIKKLPIFEFAEKHNMEIIPICAKLEEEIIELPPEEAKVFMEELSLKESGLNKIIKTGYQILNYITFLTTGADETRAWTITKNTAAPQAAGKIHTDMERGFIRMEVVAYKDIVEYGNEANAKSAGKMRIEGKDYIVQDGDVVNVRFSV